MLLEDARIGEIVVQSGRPLADRACATRTASRRSCASRIRTPSGPSLHVSLRVASPTTSTSRRTAAAVGVDERGQRRPVPARVGARQGPAGRPEAALASSGFGQSVPESFVFSPDGRYLYGSSYYTGVSNIFRYEVATGDGRGGLQRRDRLLPTGAARRWPARRARLHRGRLRSRDHRAEAARRTSARSRSSVPSSRRSIRSSRPGRCRRLATVDYDKLVTERGPYEPLRNVRLAIAYPVLQGYKNSAGARLPLQLPIRSRSRISASRPPARPTRNLGASDSAATSTSPGITSAGGAQLSWNRSDFYDLFGPTKRSRKGLAAKLGYDDLLIYDEPRKLTLSYDVAFYDKIDTLPNAQNVETTFTRLADRRGWAALHRRPTLARRRRRREGHRLDAASTGGNARAARRRRRCSAASIYGLPLPLAHSSIWLRTAAGADRRRDNPMVANFYFGGFGNNYVDNGPMKRYREYDSLPGFGSTRSAGRVRAEMVEWNLPPVVLEYVGTPALPELAAPGGVRVGTVDRSGSRYARTTQASAPRSICVSRSSTGTT